MAHLLVELILSSGVSMTDMQKVQSTDYILQAIRYGKSLGSIDSMKKQMDRLEKEGK